MIYVTDHYQLKKFDTEEQAIKYINADIQKHGLNFEIVYDHTENDIRVMIYQYNTLYLQTYVIHNKIDLRK